MVEESFNGTTVTVTAGNGWGPDGWRMRFYPGAQYGVPFPNDNYGNPYGGQYFAYTYDPQGSRVQRHSQRGAQPVFDTAAYSAFGSLMADHANYPGDVLSVGANGERYSDPVGFGGQFGYYTDAETGISPPVLLTHRYYDPSTGRFLTRDPIGYDGGVNLYGFAGNNPVTQMDPSGNAFEPIDFALDLAAVTFDLWKLNNDKGYADLTVDRTSLGLDLAGLLPFVPPGAGRAWAMAHGGIETVHALQALRQAQTAAKVVQGGMMAASRVEPSRQSTPRGPRRVFKRYPTKTEAEEGAR